MLQVISTQMFKLQLSKELKAREIFIFRIGPFSDRRILKGQYPYIGVLMEESDKHREPKFKAEMLAKFGRETGINPSEAWPTKEQVKTSEQEFFEI
jgi:hypothetical protein